MENGSVGNVAISLKMICLGHPIVQFSSDGTEYLLSPHFKLSLAAGSRPRRYA
jgi:hypothetical protein